MWSVGGLRDIESRADCERLVTAFYERALEDPLIGFFFVDVAKIDLDEHIPVVASFWETILLGTRTYTGGAFGPHAALHMRAELQAGHFERWLVLWRTAVDEHFAGPRAELAKEHALRVAAAFLRRLRSIPACEPGDGFVVSLHGPAGSG